MSEHWTIYCEDCEIFGPDIRRSGSITLQGLWPRYHPELSIGSRGPARDPQTQWAAFLDEHGWHRLVLRHE